MEIKIGIACHFKYSNLNISACGIVNPKIAAYDGRDVNCERCKKTKAYKIYMQVNKKRICQCHYSLDFKPRTCRACGLPTR